MLQKEGFPPCGANDTDSRIGQIIRIAGAPPYDGRISGDDSFPLFYHLSSLRSALLSFYTFPQKRSRALDAGAGFGALTGMLLAQFDHVQAVELDPYRCACIQARWRCEKEQLSVVCADLAQIRPDPVDFVLAIDLFPDVKDLMEQPALVKKLAMFLEPEGVMLLGVSGRFTAKEDPAYLRLTDFLQRAGLQIRQCYLPMPDAVFAQAIYTPEYMPQPGSHDRYFEYCPVKKSLRDPLPGEAKPGEGSESPLPGYLLLELSPLGPSGAAPLPKLTFAALSNDREPAHAFATLLYDGEGAIKRALFPEGRSGLDQLIKNHKALAARGLNVLALSAVREAPQGPGGEVAMPLVQAPTLLRVLEQSALEKDALRIRDAFDQLRRDILRSAREGEEALARKHWGISEWVSREELGPVLSRGYPDMVPFNVFVQDGQFLYFDQEFALDQIPAGYIMFRALFYTWEHIPGMEKILPLEGMKDRYHLKKLWNFYAWKEKEFTDQNRQHALYAQVYRWAWDLRERPGKQAGKQAGKKHQIPDLTRQVQSVELKLLKALDGACKALGLSYFALHGTLLGAVRHGGFIPWDNDLDVGMLREDYDRLLTHGKEVFAEPFFLQTPQSDRHCFYGGYAKLRHSGTAALEEKNRGVPCHQGIWIDIFPLDPKEERPRRERRQSRQIAFLQRALFARAYPRHPELISDTPGEQISFCYWINHITKRSWLVKRLDHLCRQGNSRQERRILACYYHGRENKNRYAAKECRDLMEVPFEDTTIPIPAAYDGWLRRRYGENYLAFPPREEQKSHTDVQFDPLHSFLEY